MKKFEVRSAYPCLVKWKGGEEFLEDGLSLTFDEPQNLFIYPATGRREDIAFVLDMNSSTPQAKLFSLDDRDLYYLEPSSADCLLVKESLSVNGKTLNFEIGSTTLKIESDSLVRSINILKPKTYQLSSHDNFAILKIKSDGSDEAIIFNTETNAVQTITASKIEITDGQILCERFGHEEKYIFAEGNLVKTKSIESISRNPKITGLTFLQKIKNKEYREASLMVSERLGANEEKLSAYFGDVKEVLPLNETEFLIVKKAGHYQVRLDTKEDKVVNIEIKD